MAPGALIGAYQQDDSGGFAPCFRSPGEACSNIRCAAPRPPEPRRSWSWSSACPRHSRTCSSGFASTGSGCFPVSDIEEAVSRFEAGSMILLIGDGWRRRPISWPNWPNEGTGGRDGSRR